MFVHFINNPKVLTDESRYLQSKNLIPRSSSNFVIVPFHMYLYLLRIKLFAMIRFYGSLEESNRFRFFLQVVYVSIRSVPFHIGRGEGIIILHKNITALKARLAKEMKVLRRVSHND